MKTSIDSLILRKNSSSPVFQCALVALTAIIVTALDIMFNPVDVPTGFGVPVHDPATSPGSL